MLLALLLLHVHQPVSLGQVCESVWGGEPPASAPSVVRTYVAALRSALTATCLRLETVPGGYRLGMDPHQLDLATFERLAAAGHAALAADDPHRAAGQLTQALALWRGRPLDDLPMSGSAALQVGWLEERHWAVIEECNYARLRAGDHDRLVAELGQLAAAQPLRERLWAQWMLALYRCGRQAHALAAYRRLRERLAGELGVEPGRPVQRLHRQMLAADPALEPPAGPGHRPWSGRSASPAPPRQLPPDIAEFTGRTEELAALDTLTDPAETTAGRPVVVVAIDGMGGVGKSALAIHAAHKLQDRFPDGQLYANLHGATAGVPPSEPLVVLGWFLRSLGHDPAAIPAGLDEAAARFRSLVAGRRLLVLLDNARDADQVRPLLPAGGSCAALVTSRRVLATVNGAQFVHLDVLPGDQALTLLGRIADVRRVGAERGDAEELVQLCGSLPLAIRVVAARLAARPSWPLRALVQRLTDTARRLSELHAGDLTVRASFDVSLSALRASDIGLDRAAAAAFGSLALPDGPDLSLPSAAALLGHSEPEAEALLERLVDARLLDSPRPGRYQFHDLVRLYARELAIHDLPERLRLAPSSVPRHGTPGAAAPGRPAPDRATDQGHHRSGRRTTVDRFPARASCQAVLSVARTTVLTGVREVAEMRPDGRDQPDLRWSRSPPSGPLCADCADTRPRTANVGPERDQPAMYRVGVQLLSMGRNFVMVQGFWRTTLTGLVAGVVFTILSVLTFYGLGDGVLSGILSDPAIQSPKYTTVWETLEPLPVLRTAPYIIFAGWTGFLIGWAFLFRHICVLWPRSYWTRLWRLALLIWFFSLFFFEFLGPYNLLAEPLPLIALELLFWAFCALGASAVIVAMIRRAGTAPPGSTG